MNTKKKILFLVTRSEFGGAQRFIYTFVTSLSGYNVIVGAGPEGDDKKGLLLALEEQGINVRHLKYLRRSINPLFDFLGTLEILRLIKKEKPDILFLNSTKAGAIGGLVGRLTGTKNIIYRIGGWTFNDPWPNWKKKLYILIEKYTAKFKDYIVNNASSDKKQAIELGIKPKKELTLIHNGIDVSRLEKEFLIREKARKELNLNQSDFVVGAIANFYPPKGLKYLIEAASLLSGKDIKFIIIGDGEERTLLEKVIEEKNLKNNFILKGVIPEAYRYLKAFDIFVLPSVKEGFPWTILEAMSAEVPVIATKVGAVPEVIRNNKNGILIEPENPQQISGAIEMLIDDKGLQEILAKEGKKIVTEEFNLKTMVKKYEALFFIN